MKANVVQIAWHQAQSITSVDFCPTIVNKFATAGLDGCVRLWSITDSQDKDIIPEIKFVSTLAAHLAGVNIVRWAPNGICLASADNVGSIVLWKQQHQSNVLYKSMHVNEDLETYLEHWSAARVLTGHRDEINDLAWSPCGKYIASVGTDQKVRVWDVARGDVIGSAHHHTDLVQGIAWDPLGEYIVTQSIDRTINIYTITVSILKDQQVALLNLTNTLSKFNTIDTLGKSRSYKLFSDLTHTSFFRRPSFARDGSVLVCPCANVPQHLTQSCSTQNGVFVYKRESLASQTPTPNLIHTGFQSPVWVSRFCPIGNIYAVGTDESVLLYDSQSPYYPVLLVQNLHVYRYQDLAFSNNGQVLIAASHDGYCSIICFQEEKNELGLQSHVMSEVDQSAKPEEAKVVDLTKTVVVDLTQSSPSPLPTSLSPQESTLNEPVKKRITPTLISQL